MGNVTKKAIEKRCKNTNDLGARITKMRIEKNMKQEELAEKLHIKRDLLSRYENNSRTIPPDILRNISKILNVSTDYLLGLSEYIKYPAEEIHKMLGLSENAMENLYSLQHECEEVEDLNDEKEISETFRRQLNALNLLLSDKRNLPSILNGVIYYIEKKKEIAELEKNDEHDFLTNYNIEHLEIEAIELKARIELFLYKSLDKITYSDINNK